MSATVTLTNTPAVSGACTPVPPSIARPSSSKAASPPSPPPQLLPSSPPQTPAQAPVVDIEHVPVQNDPRKWSSSRKWATVAILAWAAMLPSMAANIWFPALEDIRQDLHTTDGLIAVTVSLYILFQGIMPLVWAPLSDLFGRKPIFITSLLLFTASSALAGAMTHMAGLIVFRLFQATGASAVLSIAAGSLAEIYEPHERGSKLGMYYTMPILGPAISPFVGGLLTQYTNWRSSFWFIAACGASNVLAFFFYKDTYRRERSLVWQVALARHSQTLPPPSPPHSEYPPRKLHKSFGIGKGKVRPRFADISPLSSAGRVLARPHNLIALSLSGIIFASNYVLNYSATRTFAAAPYDLSPLEVGAILLTMGVGGVFGSLGGGYYSDRCLRARPAPGGGLDPEQRIRSILPALVVCPIFMIAFAWATKAHAHISVSAITLFVIGLTQNWAYSATLSYMVDTNPGRSTGAVAVNSMFRGVSACVGSLIANPLQQAVGIGTMFTAWAALIAIASVFAAMLVRKGRKWRDIEWGRSK